MDRDRAHEILEAFYSLNDRPGLTPQEAQAGLTQELLNLCGSIPVPEYGSITFVGSLPYGFAYPEYPSTHLFKYPDLGSAVVNGFAAEQQLQPGTGVVMLVDPGTTPAPEIKSAVDLLEPRRAFIRVYEDRGANVRHVSEMVEHFPYDLLIFATHCGDSSGYRQTYEYTDSEGLNRTVVDLAVGFQRTDDPEILKVGHFFRFVSLDGVDWTDRTAKAKLYVGEAVHDFNRLMDSGPSTFKYTKRETIDRVVGSSAMMMSDSNFIFAQHSIAGMGTPVIINNACVSWHRLAGDMNFAGARAYIGTLFPVTPIEASEVVTRILDTHWGNALAIALWAAQRDVYERSQRRPYVVSGVYPHAFAWSGLITRRVSESASAAILRAGRICLQDSARVMRNGSRPSRRSSGCTSVSYNISKMYGTGMARSYKAVVIKKRLRRADDRMTSRNFLNGIACLC
ncbi:hypothetical protein V5279_39125 [Bradyrhizobium sp. 26S5]|uniref:hypothetical protein n=1 Tax=Bradyrhizobium sp. 26S5 TaxID=3139729 RepID=UPI0030D52D93